MSRKLVRAGIILLTAATLLLNPFKSKQVLSEPPVQTQTKSVIIKYIKPDKEKLLKLISEGTGIAGVDCDTATKIPAAIDLGSTPRTGEGGCLDCRIYLPSVDIRSARVGNVGTALELRGRRQLLFGAIDGYIPKLEFSKSLVCN